MIDLGDLTIVLFALAVICVGALALGFIADGWGKFRAPIRKAEESFDQQAIDGTLGKPAIPPAPPSRLYDQSIDGYI